MKPWIKELIKSSELGYLTFRATSGLRTIPFPYLYRRGRLVSTIPVLNADIIEALGNSPAVISIANDEHHVEIKVRANIDQGDLSYGWQDIEAQVRDFDDTDEIDNLPQYNKRVVVELVPSVIRTETEDGPQSYELEILT